MSASSNWPISLAPRFTIYFIKLGICHGPDADSSPKGVLDPLVRLLAWRKMGRIRLPYASTFILKYL
jgi:hypothetical protein